MTLRVCLFLLLGLTASCRRQEAPPPAAPADAPSEAAVRGTREGRLSHATPYLPAQCYTKTRDAQGKVHNPCFVCHQASRAPNYIDDADIQLTYAVPEPSMKNPWTNLFVDRRAAIAAIPDAEMLAYVRQGNYLSPEGAPLLARTLAQLPESWDFDGNGRWDGYTPDAFFRFDTRGFDLTPSGEPSGWRALAYAPLPGTFWPTNGSFGDVLVRLPPPFRQDDKGQEDLDIYALNLSILESVITRRDVPVSAVDERAHGVDLDGDGRLGRATQVRFVWRPLEGMRPSWVGKARELQQDKGIRATAGLFPVGTEFLHAVYYLDVKDGRTVMAPRMKELRYMSKKAFVSYGTHELAAAEEMREAEKRPEATRQLLGDPERGVGNRAGWMLQGFIEDARGDLRPQSLEEHAACAGCHSGVGATDDSVFSFGRKLPTTAFREGWFHWSQHDLRGIPEPRRADGQWEYTHYLQQNGAGDEFRGNREVQERFFEADGSLREEAIRALHTDISTLLLPSPQRALQLDKAYRLIVQEQSFIRGRDAVVEPVREVHRDLSLLADLGLETGITEPVPGPRYTKAPPALDAPTKPVPAARANQPNEKGWKRRNALRTTAH